MEHPVPQNITSFQFRLVGDMTLKQFGFLASGCALAYLTFLFLFSRNPFMSVILIMVFILFGSSFAFVPIADRPLDHWALAFFRAIYSPTLGTWKNPFGKTGETQVADPVFTGRLQNYLISQNLEIAPPKPTLLSQLPLTISIPASPSASLGGPKLIRMAPQTVSPPRVILPASPVIVPPPPKIVPALILPPKFQPVQKSMLLTSLPNVVNGIVSDLSGNYLENVIVIIHNQDGVPVRASKTNKLGQFSGATPLPAGEYKVTFEKEGLNFEILKVVLKNEILTALNVQPMKGNV